MITADHYTTKDSAAAVLQYTSQLYEFHALERAFGNFISKQTGDSRKPAKQLCAIHAGGRHPTRHDRLMIQKVRTRCGPIFYGQIRNECRQDSLPLGMALQENFMLQVVGDVRVNQRKLRITPLDQPSACRIRLRGPYSAHGFEMPIDPNQIFEHHGPC